MADADTNYDIAVVGAGPAGIMAAIQASNLGLKVVLLEKNKQLGKKFLLTGGGRCNITNAEFSAEGGSASGGNLRDLVKNYNNGEFLFHAFSVFGPKETIAFFEKLGIKTKIENNPSASSGQANRVFPAELDADEVLEVLKKYLIKNKVKILYSSEVTEIKISKNKIKKIVLTNPSTDSGQAREITAKSYILATGGKSYPATGSDGFGYKLAEKLGHTIVAPLPALTAIKLKDNFVKNLQAISLKDARINVFENNKKIFSEDGDIIFTHFGVSGPAVLNASSKIVSLLDKKEVKTCIDIFPLLNQEQLLNGLEDEFKKYARQTIKNVLSSFVSERLAEVLLDIIKIDKSKMANSLSKIEKFALVKILKNFEITPEETLGWDTAMVTKGGVSLKEIDHKTMKSKIIDDLFFAGEIIDVDGKTGGFNLQTCWTTGYLAGQS